MIQVFVQLHDESLSKPALQTTAVVTTEPPEVLIWQGQVFQCQVRSYSLLSGTTFKYLKVESQGHLNNIVLPQA
jgi:hypothetical protein